MEREYGRFFLANCHAADAVEAADDRSASQQSEVWYTHSLYGPIASLESERRDSELLPRQLSETSEGRSPPTTPSSRSDSAGDASPQERLEAFFQGSRRWRAYVDGVLCQGLGGQVLAHRPACEHLRTEAHGSEPLPGSPAEAAALPSASRETMETSFESDDGDISEGPALVIGGSVTKCSSGPCDTDEIPIQLPQDGSGQPATMRISRGSRSDAQLGLRSMMAVVRTSCEEESII